MLKTTPRIIKFEQYDGVILDLGANDYVAKSFDYKLLVKRVKNVVENSRRTN